MNPPQAQDRLAGYNQCSGQAHFWLRRLHSLMGIVFGGYIVVHLIVNATGLWPKVYQQNVDKIHQMEPMLPAIEIIAIFTPLLIHLIYGIYIATAGVSYETTVKYNYGGNWRYLLQRITGILLIAFLLYHIGTLHKWGLALLGVKGYPLFNDENTAYQSAVAAIKTPYESAAANCAVMTLYLLGTWSAAFHFANGLWTAAIAWGLTTTRAAQKRWGNVCCAAGIGLLLVGTVAWVAFTIVGKPLLPIEDTMTVHPITFEGEARNTPFPSPRRIRMKASRRQPSPASSFY